MKKFSEYSANVKNERGKEERIDSNESAFSLLKRVASKYEGASEDELIDAIILEARKAKSEGRLSEQEITNFVNMISPMLNDLQRSKLTSVIKQIKSS